MRPLAATSGGGAMGSHRRASARKAAALGWAAFAAVYGFALLLVALT